MIAPELLLMGAFLVLIVVVLMIDLLWVGRGSHVVSSKEAFVWSGVWIGLASLFYFFLHQWGALAPRHQQPRKTGRHSTKICARFAVQNHRFREHAAGIPQLHVADLYYRVFY